MDEYDKLKEMGIGQPRCYSELPAGWWNLFFDAMQLCKDAGWDGRGLTQFKEKFGRLVVYIDIERQSDLKKTVDAILHTAAESSITICQDCGKDGKLTRVGGLVLTTCNDCKEK